MDLNDNVVIVGCIPYCLDEYLNQYIVLDVNGNIVYCGSYGDCCIVIDQYDALGCVTYGLIDNDLCLSRFCDKVNMMQIREAAPDLIIINKPELPEP